MIAKQDKARWQAAFDRIFSERRMVFLALLVLPIAALLLFYPLTEFQRLFLDVADWVIWAIFVAEFGSRLLISDSKAKFLTSNPLSTMIDAIIVFSPLLILSPEATPALALLKDARFIRLTRLVRSGAYILRVIAGVSRLSSSFTKNKLYHYIAFALIIIPIGAWLVYQFEHPTNEHFSTYGDAVWWALVTVSTGTALVALPQTPEGRIITGGLMLVGIGFIAMVTANVAAFFIEKEEKEVDREQVEIIQRLDRIESTLQELKTSK